MGKLRTCSALIIRPGKNEGSGLSCLSQGQGRGSVIEGSPNVCNTLEYVPIIAIKEKEEEMGGGGGGRRIRSGRTVLCASQPLSVH